MSVQANGKESTRTAAVRALLARPVAFHPALARLCGSVTAGLMLSQALYWSDRTGDGSGWFYKTREQWIEETCLGREEQETARRVLREAGFLEEDRRGMPARMYYRVDVERVCDALEQLAAIPPTRRRQSRQQEGGNPANRETRQQDGGNPANMMAGNQPTFFTETTAESTAETTAGAVAPFVIPEWIPLESWKGFLEMRKKLRYPLTDHGARLIVKKLAVFRNRGMSPGDVLDQSTAASYRGVFELRSDGNGRSPAATGSARTQRNNAALEQAQREIIESFANH